MLLSVRLGRPFEFLRKCRTYKLMDYSRKRGKRHKGRYFYSQSDTVNPDDGNPSGDTASSQNGRERPPSGLKGRDIGMWYAQRSKEKNKKREKQERGVVNMDSQRERHITQLLHNIRTQEQIPPQPNTSYRDLPDDDSLASTSYQRTPAEETWDDDRDHASVSKERYFQQSDSDSDVESDTWNNTDQNLNKQFLGTMQSALDGDSFSDATQKTVVDGNLETMEKDEESQGNEMSELRKYNEDEWDFSLEYMPLDINNDKFYTKTDTGSHDYCEEEMSSVEVPDRRKPNLDAMLFQDFQNKMHNRKYVQMQDFRKNLPSFNMKQKVIDVIHSNQVIVISGETGCGKTTQVPQFILDDFISRGDGSLCRIVCTQPRRISAVSVAQRVADERAEQCGDSTVGYQIRLESKLPRDQGCILYCTTGILLKWLQSDPLLLQTTHIILDEIHERDLHSDFLIIILRDLLPRRPDLKLILMSATLNAEMFSQYFGCCPMVHIPGFTYPVKQYLLEDIIETLRYKPPTDALKRINTRTRGLHGSKRQEKMQEMREKEAQFESWLHKQIGYSHETINTLRNINCDVIDMNLVKELIRHIVTTQGDGAILVFVPGWDQIKKLHDLLKAEYMFNTGKFLVLPLHSLMPTVNQREVFDRPPQGVRKIIIATNIAETSITIDDVVYVIDCGKIKLKTFDPSSNISTLLAEWVSRANAKQRSGRAGRVQAGVCYHLYTSFQESYFADYQLPEMLRTRLEELCLQIKILKLGRILPFVQKAMQPPSLDALQCAVTTLEALNALDENEELTPLGFHLAKMPVDPHTGKMILFGAMFSCINPILTIAASLSFKDAFVIPLGKEHAADARKRELSEGTKSDHIMLAKTFDGWERAKQRRTDRQYCWDNFLSVSTLRLLADMKHQLAELLFELGFLPSRNVKDPKANANSNNLSLLRAVLCAGLYPNVAKLRVTRLNSRKRPPLVNVFGKEGEKIAIHPKSVNSNERNFESKWMVYHLKMKTTSIYLYDCTTVSPYPLLFFGGSIDTMKEEGMDCIQVDKWITFYASPKIAQLVKELRKELDKLLEHKITHTGVTDWNTNTKEGALMTAILDLITTEECQNVSRKLTKTRYQ